MNQDPQRTGVNLPARCLNPGQRRPFECHSASEPAAAAPRWWSNVRQIMPRSVVFIRSASSIGLLMMIPVIAGLLTFAGPAVHRAAQSAHHVRSANSLKQIALAKQYYHEQIHTLPGDRPTIPASYEDQKELLEAKVGRNELNHKKR